MPMKPPSKKLWAALIAAVCVVTGVTAVAARDMGEARNLRDSDVVFINGSDIPVGSVGISFSHEDGTRESGAGMNADGSPLGRGDRMYFDADGWPVELTVCADQQGTQPLASAILAEEPRGADQTQVWYVIAREGAAGMELTLSLNLDEDDLASMEKNISKNLGVDVSGGVIGCCWYPGHGWQGDGEDFVVLRFSPEEGEKLLKELSAAQGWRQGTYPADFRRLFGLGQRKYVDWDNVSPNGWYYYRNERESSSGTRSGETFGSWDFVAAVYDPERQTLWFLEHHQ